VITNVRTAPAVFDFPKNDPKGAVAAPFGLDTATAQSTFQPEKITLGTAGSPAGFL
jgi:hypothetical protein